MNNDTDQKFRVLMRPLALVAIAALLAPFAMGSIISDEPARWDGVAFHAGGATQYDPFAKTQSVAPFVVYRFGVSTTCQGSSGYTPPFVVSGVTENKTMRLRKSNFIDHPTITNGHQLPWSWHIDLRFQPIGKQCPKGSVQIGKQWPTRIDMVVLDIPCYAGKCAPFPTTWAWTNSFVFPTRWL